MNFCVHCNLEHPAINGLLSNEIVRGSHPFKYRGLNFEIWIIENPNSHWWAWAVPIDKTKDHIEEIRKTEFLLTFAEGYYIPNYIYREAKLTTKELALQDAKEALKDSSDSILDKTLPAAEKRLQRLKEVLEKWKDEK